MIVVIKKADPGAPPRFGGRRGAMIVAVLALAVAGGAWFWLARQTPQPQAGYGLPHGVIVIGLGTFLTVLVAQIRSMSVVEALETLWDALALIVAMLWGAAVAALKAIWSWFLGLIGWD